jgi:cell division protein FtsB
VECEEEDPEYVWRLKTMLENERARVASLKTMLVNQDSTIGNQEAEIESLQEENEWKEAEIGSLQKGKVYLQEENERLEKDKASLQQEIERLRDESAVAQENERLRAAAAKVTTLVEGLEVGLRCPLSLELVEKPVVSRYGHTYSRSVIETWITKKTTCPFRSGPMRKDHLVTNLALTTVLDAFNAYQAPAAAPPAQEKPAE